MYYFTVYDFEPANLYFRTHGAGKKSQEVTNLYLDFSRRNHISTMKYISSERIRGNPLFLYFRTHARMRTGKNRRRQKFAPPPQIRGRGGCLTAALNRKIRFDPAIRNCIPNARF